MFEVKKKFILKEKDIERLIHNAEFLGERMFVDEYFDNEIFSLSTQDIWLRKRGKKFQLKIPLHMEEGESFGQYQEIEGELAIREIFAIPIIKNFVEDLYDLGHSCFCRLTTTRKKYKKENFVIDLDEVNSGDWKYLIGEIELIVEERNEISVASKKIEEFAKENNLEIAPESCTIIEYVRQKRPAHYQALVEAGIIIEG